MIPELVETERVRLRRYRVADAAALVAGCDDPLTRRFLPNLPEPYTQADARWWITEGAPAAWTAGGAAFAIADPGTDKLLGGIGIGNLVPSRGQGEVGYWVAPWARGRGVATAATRTLSDRVLSAAFARLELLTHLENGASQRVALAAGFRQEGVRRGAAPAPGGGRYDLVAWSRLAEDPAVGPPRLLPDLPGGVLTDGVVTLRRIGVADVEFLHTLTGLPDVIATSVPPVRRERTETEQRCARAESRWIAGERADLIILDGASGRPAGEIGLFYQEPPTGQAMIGYAMLPAWRGRGYPTRAARLIASWAFRSTGIARLIAGTMPENIGSQRVLEKAGFQREGYLRGRLPGAAGTRIDDILYALLPADSSAQR